MTASTELQLTRIADALEALVKLLQRTNSPPRELTKEEPEWKPRWETTS